MNVRDLLHSKRDEVIRLAAEHRAHNVRVFGSCARGDADELSDIDLLVDFEPGTSLLTHASLVVALEDLLGRRVDVAPQATLKERLRQRVLSEAVPI